jgi:hypothetical protein
MKGKLEDVVQGTDPSVIWRSYSGIYTGGLEKDRELLNKDNRSEGSHLKTDPPQYDVELSASRRYCRVV